VLVLVIVLVIVIVIDSFTASASRLFRCPAFIPPMINGEQGMAREHARTGVTHGLFDFPPHQGLVAMRRAIGARGFVFLKGAAPQPLAGIVQQFAAFRAKRPRAGVMAPPAIKPDHRRDGLGFTPQTER